MGKLRDKWRKRRLRRTGERILKELPPQQIDVMPNAAPMKKPKKMMVSKGGSIRARLSSGGPVAKPN